MYRPSIANLAACLFAALLSLSGVSHAASAARASAFEYDPVSGLLTKEIIEPDNPDLCLVTTHSYDAYGNKASSTTRNCNGDVGEALAPVGAAVFATRVSTTAYAATVANPVEGQYPTASVNALGHSETSQYDPRHGKLTQLTGPNGLTTTWQYDGFGRKTRENRADGTSTQWEYAACDAACPTNAAYRIITRTLAGGVQSGPTRIDYHDSLHRKIRDAVQAADGVRWIYSDTDFNALGQIARVSRPYFAGETVFWTRSEYDDLGRLLRVYEPDDPLIPTLSVSYNGLAVSRSNRQGQITTEVSNSQGQKISVIDAMNNITTFTYDPFGNLTHTLDPASNRIINQYDRRGRKIQTSDPDLGVWRYVYNALGELVKQTDAKNQVTSMVYDKLGRMIQRVEPGMTSNWIWDSAPGKGIGKLYQATTSDGYSRTHGYDAYGRNHQTSTNFGAGKPTLASGVGFDSAGRVVSQTYYPSGFAVKQVYSSLGYLTEVRNKVSNALYWRADLRDAENHLTRETYGNGVVTEYGYQPDSGRLQNIVGYKGANQIQGHAYTYDSLGNVKFMADSPGVQLEIRGGYDALNRLRQIDSNLNGIASSQTLAYDALGNITSKSDIGNYLYGDPVHKHAVTAVSGGPVSLAYAYDSNGNLTSGGGRSIVWTAWNMPASISSGGQTQSWLYDPEHSRYKLSTAGRTTFYLNPSVHQGGHYERTLYSNGTIEHRHTLYGGGRPIGEVITFNGGAPSQTRYFHSDQQGSITAVTNETGVVLTRYRYDPWGKQTLIAGDNTGIAQTRQGHTGHEMLDNGLTHMNGRLYDPVLARFVSADPYIQYPGNLQSYNRYSYALNNPLAFTDPSGYFNLRKFVGFVSFGLLGNSKIGRTLITVAACISGPLTCAGATAASSYVSGATLGRSLQAGAQAFFTAKAYGVAGDVSSKFGNVLAHATVGCVSVSASGGECGSGALSAAAAAAWTNYGYKYQSPEANFIATTVVGGTASELGGGNSLMGRLRLRLGISLTIVIQVVIFSVAVKHLDRLYFQSGISGLLSAGWVTKSTSSLIMLYIYMTA